MSTTPHYPGQLQHAVALAHQAAHQAAQELLKHANVACKSFCNKKGKKIQDDHKRILHHRCRNDLNGLLATSRQEADIRATHYERVVIDGNNVVRGMLAMGGNPRNALDTDQWTMLFVEFKYWLKEQFPRSQAIYVFRPGHNGWYTEEIHQLAINHLLDANTQDQIQIPHDWEHRADSDDRHVLRLAAQLGIRRTVIITNDNMTEYVYAEAVILNGEPLQTVAQVQQACVQGIFHRCPEEVLDFMPIDLVHTHRHTLMALD